MKEFWLGLGLLMGILALSLGLSFFLDAVHDPVIQQLDLAAEQALSQNWSESRRLVADASSAWESHRRITAALTDHTPMEQIDRIFALLKIYGRLEETALFSSGCAELSRLIDAQGDAHSLTWWNLF